MLLNSIFEFVWDHFFKIFFGAIFAFYALGALFVIISSLFDSNTKKELDNNKLLLYGGGVVSLIVAILLIVSISNDIKSYNSKNSYFINEEYYEENYSGNISFKGKNCTAIVGCDCPGFEPRGSIGEDKFWCRHCNHKKQYHH